jgi:DTW domain-containing protein YfiP
MHPKEFKEEKVGTGRITSLQLENSQILMGVNFSDNATVNSLINDCDCYILYPTPDSINISQGDNDFFKSYGLSGARSSKKPQEKEKEKVIFIIDSTWSFAKKILKLSTNLSQLRAISFENKEISKFVFKQQPYPECLSTIESTLKVLTLLKQRGIEKVELDEFLNPFEKLLEQQIYFQNNPPSGSYRTQKQSYKHLKNKYKKGSVDNVFFEKDKKS